MERDVQIKGRIEAIDLYSGAAENMIQLVVSVPRAALTKTHSDTLVQGAVIQVCVFEVANASNATEQYRHAALRAADIESKAIEDWKKYKPNGASAAMPASS